jgi:hypothetical protein
MPAAEVMAYVALIQKAWVYGGQIRCLTNSGGTVFSVVHKSNARSCIVAKIILMNYLCWVLFRDNNGEHNGRRRLRALPYDADESLSTKEMSDVLNYCCSRKKQFFIHSVWFQWKPHFMGGGGALPPNPEVWHFLNWGNEPTCVVSNRNEDTDLTLWTNRISNLVSSWHVWWTVSIGSQICMLSNR